MIKVALLSEGSVCSDTFLEIESGCMHVRPSHPWMA
jgi:hypothetical protein